MWPTAWGSARVSRFRRSETGGSTARPSLRRVPHLGPSKTRTSRRCASPGRSAPAKAPTWSFAEAAQDLGGGVPLLARGVLVVGQDPVDDRLDRPRDGGLSLP